VRWSISVQGIICNRKSPLAALEFLDPRAASTDGIVGGSEVLTEAEHRRLSRIRPCGARQQFIAARRLARSLVADHLGATEPVGHLSLSQECPYCGSPEHGRPLPVNGAHVSWAHCGPAVAAAVHHSPVGIDAEPVSSFYDAGNSLVDMLCTPDEASAIPELPQERARALARLWTTKEALVKVGETTFDTFREFAADSDGSIIVGSAERRWWSARSGWYLTGFEMFGVAVAVVSRSCQCFRGLRCGAELGK